MRFSLIGPVICLVGWTPTAAADSETAARPLTLAQAEEQALRQQPTVRQSRGQTEVTEGRVEQARAGYLPQAALTAMYQRTTGNFAVRPGSLPTMQSTNGWSSRTYDYFNLGLSASQLIYDFGLTSGRWRAAIANRDAAQANERSARAQALLAVRHAYFQARAQKDLVEVAKLAVSNQQKHLAQIQAFVQAGMRPEIDLASVRTDLANARLDLVQAENAYAVALAQLNQAMGVTSGARFELADETLDRVDGEDGDLTGLVAAALRARPELASIARQRQAQGLTVSALRGSYAPSLGAVAGATDTGQSPSDLVPNWFVGLALNWQFLQGGATRGQIHEANGTLESLSAQEDGLRLQVEVQVEQARLAVVGAKSSIVATADALASARDQLRLAEGRYQAGLGSVIELGDAEVAFTTAAARDVQARYGLSSSRADLRNAVGEE